MAFITVLINIHVSCNTKNLILSEGQQSSAFHLYVYSHTQSHSGMTMRIFDKIVLRIFVLTLKIKALVYLLVTGTW
jgi:DNA-binding transcriptional regulator WhiA